MGRRYYTLNYPRAAPGGETFLTGIRAVGDPYSESGYVYISGVYNDPSNVRNGLFYKGCLSGKGTWHVLNYPSSPGVTVTGTAVYGPNNGPTKRHRDGTKTRTIQAVGNYNTAETGPAALGFFYQGPIDGSGTWKTLTPTSSDPVINTIVHSTMGGLVVGNYDTDLIQGKAFLYDLESDTYYDLTHPNAVSMTAYGIWQNGPFEGLGCSDQDSYTICGGYSELNDAPGFTHGYIANWNRKTNQLSDFTRYSYQNKREFSTHFDGITTDNHGGYNLTGDWVGVGAENGLGFFAAVKKLDGRARWEQIEYPGHPVTSGNSVYRSDVIGIYTDNQLTNGYVALKTHHSK